MVFPHSGRVVDRVLDAVEPEFSTDCQVNPDLRAVWIVVAWCRTDRHLHGRQRICRDIHVRELPRRVQNPRRMNALVSSKVMALSPAAQLENGREAKLGVAALEHRCHLVAIDARHLGRGCGQHPGAVPRPGPVVGVEIVQPPLRLAEG